MDIRNLHPWNIPASQAIGVQADLVRRLSLHNDFDDIGIIAGADVAMDPRTGMGFGAVVLLAYPSLEPVEVAVSKRKIGFPYVPGLLSFREGPVLLEAFERLGKEPDLIFFDGNGVAHPRGLGLASHLGLVLDKPTIGVAKTKLLGNHKAPGRKEGDSAELISKGKMGRPRRAHQTGHPAGFRVPRTQNRLRNGPAPHAHLRGRRARAQTDAAGGRRRRRRQKGQGERAR
jgi:deoxyribonuclease V